MKNIEKILDTSYGHFFFLNVKSVVLSVGYHCEYISEFYRKKS